MELLSTRLVTTQGRLAFFFQPDWTPLAATEYGTQLQTARRLVEAAKVLRADGHYDEVAALLFRWVMENGWDGPSRGFRHGRHIHRPARREWWIAWECVRAMAALEPGAEDAESRAALEGDVWSYLRHRVLDEVHGGTFAERRAAVAFRGPAHPGLAKGNVWKDGSHEGLALLQMLDSGAA